ncbi:hypothetical protein BJ138DRAFT_1111538 [Hygrophoropsis aurantiaca]|uniref:Uncharacterized protein n=1 Tax=Hygrophoropsis aurantiaca TaxID=72124 RepID=A0ACB8AIT1_9AGAM|nr:hypothetical protein BJ138DRAFT_1111538 [Hygrophoropsis aurantiaca]
MANSDKSTSSSSSASSPPPSLVALPSMSHSLAALPTMSSVPKDMLHYGNAGVHSRAKMEYALQKQQRQQYPAGHLQPDRYAYDIQRTPSPSHPEDTQITVRSKQRQVGTQMNRFPTSSQSFKSSAIPSDGLQQYYPIIKG